MANYNIRKIKLGRCYFINELSDFGIERRTFYRWRKKGLKVIDENEKLLLVRGIDLINFYKAEKTKRKVNLKEDEFYCFKCHKAVKAKKDSEEIIKTGKRIGKNLEQVRKIAICEHCETKLNRYLRGVKQD